MSHHTHQHHKPTDEKETGKPEHHEKPERHGHHHHRPAGEKTMSKLEQHDHRIEHFFRRILHAIERIIAVVTIVVLIISLGMELWKIKSQGMAYFSDINGYLHNVLNLVVGLEFVRMLIDTTPASILEVLTVAITRHVILSHDSPWSILAYIICVAALFAIRRFLIRRNELKEEMVEME